MARSVLICRDGEELAERAASRIRAAATHAVAERGRFTLCLCGGDTPVQTYARLGMESGRAMPWQATHVFWGDERCAPLKRPDNHFMMASNLLLSRVPIPAENLHRPRGEAAKPAEAALKYEMTLRTFFDLGAGQLPVFDLVLLGMGEDGHTASLFPGSDGWNERDRLVVDHYVVKRGERVRRLTMTEPVLTAAGELVFLVSGSLKAEMLAAVLEGDAAVPAAEIDRKAGQTVWIVDQDAACQLAGAAVAAEGAVS